MSNFFIWWFLIHRYTLQIFLTIDIRANQTPTSTNVTASKMKKNKEGHAYRHCMRDVQCCLYDVQRWTTLTPERWHPWLHDYRWWTVLVWYGVRGDWRKITWREKRVWRKIEKRKQGNGEEGSQTLKKGKREWLGGRGGGSRDITVARGPLWDNVFFFYR